MMLDDPLGDGRDFGVTGEWWGTAAAADFAAATSPREVAPLQFRPMLAGDAVLLSLQPSQHFELGLEHKQFTMDEGEELADGGEAWTSTRGSRIVAIAGFREMFKAGSGHAVVWAALSDDIGADHLAITRFARGRILNADYRRLEAIVDASDRRAVQWAQLVGLTAVHVLRGYGPEGKTHILFERVKA